MTTHYIGNYYEVINPGASQVVKKYYYAGGTRVAMSDNGTIRYFVTDHLGSTTRLINVDGSEYSDMSYLAWGSDRLTPPGIGTSFKYTGQRQAEAGLYYYNARWYDPLTGRFIQADSIIPEPGNPLAWDRYAYGYNNPVKYMDPSGHKACEDQGNGTICSNDRGQTPKTQNEIGLIGSGNSSSSSESENGMLGNGGDTTGSSGDSDVSRTLEGTETPNPSLFGLAIAALIIHGVTVLTEAAIIIAETFLIPLTAAQPEIVVLDLILAGAGIAALDFDISFLVYTYRVQGNPEVHQEFEILPPWGLGE